MARPVLFVVLTTQRSGSSWLVDLLNDHPDVVAYAELFRAGDSTVPDYGATQVPRFEVMCPRGLHSTSRSLVLRRRGYVAGLGKAHAGARAVGFKLMYDQAPTHRGLMSTLVLARARFVHLVRRDQVSALVSFDLARDRDRWRYHDGDEVPATAVEVDPGELLRRLDERDGEVARVRRRLSRLPVSVCEVAYEDLRESTDEVLRVVLDFLGVPPPPHPLRSSLIRTGPGTGLDAVVNRAEIVAALSETRYAVPARGERAVP